MAGYFSNHSQSRFLSNSQGVTTTNTGGTMTATTPTTLSQPSGGTGRAPVRVPSRHFSTSLTNPSSAEEKSHTKEKSSSSGTTSNGGTAPTVHPLRNTWIFWFRQHRAPGNKITNYEEGIKKISAFSSVESFWSLWTHLHPPSSLLPTTDYLLFHSGIRRPVWEDPLNITGGKWIIRLKKGVSDRLWEDLVLAVIGDQFDECEPETRGANANGNGEEVWPEICGCTISVRQNEDIITVWNRVENDAKVKDKINSTIRRVLSLPGVTNMEYKSNNDSMQDKSSFRIPTGDRTPMS